MVAMITASIDTMCNNIKLVQPRSRASSAAVCEIESNLRNTQRKSCEPFPLDQVLDVINYNNQIQLKSENHHSTFANSKYLNNNSIKD
jgi:hypothetical protein